MTCPYQIRMDDAGYHVVRPTISGGYFVVAGPYNTHYEAEVEARRRRERSPAPSRAGTSAGFSVRV